MDSFLPRFKNVFFLATLLVVQTIGLAVQVRRPIESGEPDGAHVLLARSWVVGAVAPVERLLALSGRAFRNGWSEYVDLRNARAQNRELTEQIAQLRLQQAAIAEDAVQGHRLQALLAFQEHYVASTVAAQVIGTSGSDLSRVLYIDKGAADGLKPDMAVVTPDGIVGKIRDVFPHAAPHTAQVLLINDQTSGAGVLLSNTRLRAVVHGTASGEVQIGNLTPDARIKPGEPVLTSGGDQIYPRGLPVGTIESIAPDPEHSPYTAIRIKPAANLFQLEEVLVITGSQPSLPRATLDALSRDALQSAQARTAAQKAAAARAAAEAAAREQSEAQARTAAEAAADRLPSLHDSTAENPEGSAAAKADAANPKNAGGTVPKPAPAIRPDRYSPGATPSANDLQPGAPHPTDTSPARPQNRSTPATAPEPQP